MIFTFFFKIFIEIIILKNKYANIKNKKYKTMNVKVDARNLDELNNKTITNLSYFQWNYEYFFVFSILLN